MKKMRKLIPAFAMLLVSAIMMSTASFAWFTMNETVEATGMQIQAQAAGSLVIKENDPLLYNDTKSVINFTSGVSKLSPITVDPATGTWKAPTKVNNVDPHTGMYEGQLSTKTPTPGNGGDYVEKVLFIASAGDALTQQKITVTLGDEAHPADKLHWKAYSAAIYVVTQSNDGTWENPAINKKPDAVLHLMNSTTQTATLTNGGAGYTIPSITGIESADNAVGIKIVVRFFIDGDLDAGDNDTMEVPATIKHIAGAAPAEGGEAGAVYAALTYNAALTYYQANGAPLNTELFEDGVTAIPAGAYYIENTTATTTEFKYVNSDDIPVAYTEMSISFTAGKINP